MAGYSPNPLSKKLGIKEGVSLYVKNPPADYLQLLDPIPEDVKFVERLSAGMDMIHFFTKHRAELQAELALLLTMIKQNGMIWISWPKKSSRVETDITEDVIREVSLPMGLVDIKVCAVDHVWSGLKLVIRKENRR
ncbi:DUF3052 domain-containing protein [Hahella sp. CCB-MM4]|uniref:DUF3052 family protein n=1 Tax=Hahella sp. (strain CCB-MM4) TaxID=1926491 RepID=UPI000B9B4255|nr:DUF3052 family protein [Hahella sp. CCB-MM4]OZG75015.1 DUF3052 domain-containing protein [Hahella sp. CCB-MM4]